MKIALYLCLLFHIVATEVCGIYVDEHSFLYADLPCGMPDVVLSIGIDSGGNVYYSSNGVFVEANIVRGFVEGAKRRSGKKGGFVYVIAHADNYALIFDLYEILSEYGDGEIYLLGDSIDECIRLSNP